MTSRPARALASRRRCGRSAGGSSSPTRVLLIEPLTGARERHAAGRKSRRQTWCPHAAELRRGGPAGNLGVAVDDDIGDEGEDPGGAGVPLGGGKQCIVKRVV